MGFFESLKKYKSQLDAVDSSVYYGSKTLLEVYERNAKLEAEIAQRTNELDRANKQMLTLQHIWNMMNSSEPLSNVLNAIVNSLQGELGYVYSFIIQPQIKGEESYIQVAASSRQDFSEKFEKLFHCKLTEYKLVSPGIDGL